MRSDNACIVLRAGPRPASVFFQRDAEWTRESRRPGWDGGGDLRPCNWSMGEASARRLEFLHGGMTGGGNGTDAISNSAARNRATNRHQCHRNGPQTALLRLRGEA